jgi:hypothetical protein
MNSFFQRTVEALLPTAVNYAPEGTEAKAVAHQWLNIPPKLKLVTSSKL